MTAAHSERRQQLGFWLGVLGVALFAITLPATRLATGSAADPQLAPLFVTVGRAATAGLLSLAFLLATRSPWPKPSVCCRYAPNARLSRSISR